MNCLKRTIVYFSDMSKNLIKYSVQIVCSIAFITSLLTTGCDRKPYDMVDGYMFVQKEERRNDSTEWQLVWSDEFNDPSLDTAKWTKIDRFTDLDFRLSKEDWLRDKEKWKDINNISCFSYTSGNPVLYNFADGMLILDGIVNTDTLTDPRPYLQGAIKSKRKFAFQYGKIEIYAKLEGAGGAWPAFWMLSEKEIYEDLPHRNGEIDIMERLNHEDSVYQTTHSHWSLDMKQDQNPPHYSKGKINPDGYNVFGLEWYPEKLVYTVNGITTYEYPKLEDVVPAQWPFDQPFYVMLDQQLGGSWVGEVDPEDLPAKVIIDWIRLYQ
jgi:beta-glucanase (GH16 family)